MKKQKRLLLTILCLIVLVLLGYSSLTGSSVTFTDQSWQTATAVKDQKGTLPSNPNASNTGSGADIAPVSGTLQVHFIDVGQADCILIEAPSGKTMLIDAGNNEDAGTVTSYIEKQKISKLDIVVGTHPHEDHIGGLDAVIDAFKIGQVIMPSKTHTTETFKDVLGAVKNKGLKITPAKTGVKLNLGDGVTAVVLAPNGSDYEDLNNYSAVIRIAFGSTSFLFTGDVGEMSESEMLRNVSMYALGSTVLKVGHHGSSDATSEPFLDLVDPTYATICVGKGNDYDHPAQETLEKLKNRGVKVFRTDLDGTIVAVSDGSEVTFHTPEIASK